jgi:hypothetical protein
LLDHRPPVVGLDNTLVGDLAAAGRIERRLAQLQPQQAVALVDQRSHLSANVQLLVADELGREAGVQLRRAVADRGGAGARPLALLVHQAREAGLVDRDAVLGGDLGGQLEREAVGVVQLERVGRLDLRA